VSDLPSGDGLPVAPPIEPMLAKLADALPTNGAFLFEPKWDGFRAIVFRGASDVFIQSRDLRPLDRYFPERATTAAAVSSSRGIGSGRLMRFSL
jgi:ATP-dependent DNA ligase